MKKILTIAVASALILTFTLGVQVAFALTDYASDVVGFNQGLKKNGSAVDAARSDPTKALGPEDSQFVTLGYGGELVVAFPIFVGGVLTITAYETTFGSYPEENADVYVSDDAVNWSLIGTADNLTNQPNNVPHPSVFQLGEDCIKYVKLIDSTDSSLHGATSDGFDVDAVKVDYEEECCPCEEEECCDAPTIVINNNEAFVCNKVKAEANTGDNSANGSTGGDGGDGGDINNSDGDVRRSTTGSGGAGGNGGDGGIIITGDATAEAGVINVVNTSRTTIDHCACDDYVCDCGPDIVVNRSRAIVLNHVEADADTGDNEANGGEGDDGGDGGDINNGDGCDSDVEDSDTGDGGTGGHGGWGGYIETGDANASAGAINVVNRNVTRIRR